MADTGQTDLAGFGDEADDPDRDVEAEARAVAGPEHGTDRVVDPEREAVPDAEGTVELAVTQVDYTLVGTGREERPIVHVFGRTEDRRIEHVKVLGFRPYFYAPTDTLDDETLDDDRITGTEEGYESIRGEDLTRVYGRTPRDVGQMRDEFEHYEADILFPNRLLIDKDLRGGVRVPERRDDDGTLVVPHDEVEPADVAVEPRVLTLDIEVDDRRGFPEDGEEPILCLTTHDSYDDEYVLWLYEAPEWDGTATATDGGTTGAEGATADRAESASEDLDLDLDGYEPIRGDVDVDVRTFSGEAAMLDALVTYVERTDQDVLTGWNFEDFDMPYLLDRMEVLDARPDVEADLSVERLSRVDEVWRSGWGGPDVKGRVVFDLLYAYKRTQFTELESYRLDAVGEMELDVGKERYPGDIGDLWEDDPERLLEYNLRDVELCVEINREQDVIPFWMEVASFVGCLLEDAPTPGDAVDLYVLHEAHGEFALPSKGQQETEEFEGGAVFDPISGVRENVSVLDLKSLYPMAMVTINASPETRVGDDYDGATYRAPNGQRFRREPDGMIRTMVDELLAERERKKERRDEHDPGSETYERYDRQQAAVKVIMNSLYGVLGWDRFRLYDKEMGAAVTATGRAVIEFTESVANEMDYQVTYGDSVTGDRPVVVRDPAGLVQIVPIADLYERVSEGRDADLLIAADGGPVAEATVGKERAALDGWDALSMNEHGNPEWQPIEEVIRHETDKSVVNLQHKFGESTTTTDHSFVVEDDGEFVEASPDDVDEPLRIPGVPEVDTVDTLDLYEALAGYTREYEDGRGVGSENATTKTKRVHADEEYVWFGHENHHDLDKSVKLRRYVDLDGDAGHSLVRLLAAYAAEGSASTAETSNSRYGASIASSNRAWLETLQEDYHRLFADTTASIVASDTTGERTLEYGDGAETTYDDTTHKLQMMNELAAVFFREFAGQTSRGKRIPSFVFHLADDRQRLFVETLVEGDGSRKFPRYSEAYREHNFDYETASRELAAGLSMLLTQRDRKHSLKYRDEKGTYTIRTCDYYRSGRDPVVREVDHDGYVYDLSVAENENFVDAVGGVVLHNTDSVMLELGHEVSTAEAIEQSFEIEEQINERYDEFAREQLNADQHRFQIEFEKLYRRFFQAGKKKRYAGHIVWKEGKTVDDIDITGFEVERSDIAPVTKEVQRRVIEMIVTGDDPDDVAGYVSEVIEDFQEGNVDLDDVGIPEGIGKRLDSYESKRAHVRGAKYANLLLGTNFGRGSKPKRLYLGKNGVHPDYFERVDDEVRENPLYGEFREDVSAGDGVICFEYADQVPEEFQVDWDRMLERTLKKPLTPLLEAIGVSWDEAVSGQEQTGLGQFM